MRFMVMIKANKDSEAGVLPDEKLLSEMMQYNEEFGGERSVERRLRVCASRRLPSGAIGT